jgi:hypothetical protein
MEARQEGEEEGQGGPLALLWEVPEALLWEAPLHMVGHPQGKGGRGGRRRTGDHRQVCLLLVIV